VIRSLEVFAVRPRDPRRRTAAPHGYEGCPANKVEFRVKRGVQARGFYGQSVRSAARSPGRLSMNAMLAEQQAVSKEQ